MGVKETNASRLFRGSYGEKTCVKCSQIPSEWTFRDRWADSMNKINDFVPPRNRAQDIHRRASSSSRRPLRQSAIPQSCNPPIPPFSPDSTSFLSSNSEGSRAFQKITQRPLISLSKRTLPSFSSPTKYSKMLQFEPCPIFLREVSPFQATRLLTTTRRPSAAPPLPVTKMYPSSHRTTPCKHANLVLPSGMRTPRVRGARTDVNSYSINKLQLRKDGDGKGTIHTGN